MTSLEPFFRPRSVAVVGASPQPGSIGARLLDAIIQSGFRGPIYPVHPRAGEIAGLPAYSSVLELPQPVDLAVIAVPSHVVLAVVEECARCGIPALIVISAGFAETGPEGKALQEKLLARVRACGMRMIGPNCLGLVSADPQWPLNASFSPIFPPAGRVAVSSESGALALAVLAAAARLGVGISHCVSVGNRADVSSNDLLEFWEEDNRTDVIMLYLESFGNPRRFARIARRVGRSKPIVAVKGGRTRAGRRAAGSHTAALAASDVAVEALFHQTGIIRAETLKEMLDLAAALGSQPLPRGRRVAVLTNAGGPAILCADACEAGGLVLPELSSAIRDRLVAFLPAAAALNNPIDMIASANADQFCRAATILLDSGEIDALIVIYVSAGADPSAAVLRAVAEAAASAAARLPVLACVMAAHDEPAGGAERSGKIPSYEFPEEAARVLSRMADYAAWRARPPGALPAFENMNCAAARAICRRAIEERGPGWLTTVEVRELLRALSLPVAAGGVARTADEAAALAQSLGFPVAVKLASHLIVHKTEIGGVQLNLPDVASVRAAFWAIHDRLTHEDRLAAMEGVLVQPMVSGGTEVMVGVTQDTLFGPLIAFGLGGIHVEILNDVSVRVMPLTDRDASEMMRAIRGYRLLEGYRGHEPGDVAAVEELLLRVAQMVEELPEIRELDLNPVFVLPPGQGGRIVDARVYVEPANGGAGGAMKTTTNEVAAELQRLHALLVEEMEKLEKAASQAAASEMERQLTRLRDHVAEHFQFEERNGYMASVLEREPFQERATQELYEQHRELLRALDALLADVRSSAGPGTNFGERLKTWVKALRRHEAEENRLFQDAFNIEFTAED